MSTPELGFERYRPLAPRARWARIALVTMIVADVLAVLSGVREYVLLERLETDLVTAEELEASDRRQQVVALAQFAVFIVAAIFFIRDVWRASDPEAPPDQGDTWQREEPPILYAVWWIGWVVLNFAYNIDFRIYLRAETLDELQFSSLFTAVTDSASVPVALLAIAVVHRTTERQDARAVRLREGMLTPPE